MSDATFESPRRPDFLLRSASTSWASLPWFERKVRTPASTSPARVPMTRPSRGVRPIVVSTDSPWRTQHIDAPLPRWRRIAFTDATGLPRARATSLSTKE